MKTLLKTFLYWKWHHIVQTVDLHDRVFWQCQCEVSRIFLDMPMCIVVLFKSIEGNSRMGDSGRWGEGYWRNVSSLQKLLCAGEVIINFHENFYF